MPARYFDTSALVKRYVREVGSSWIRVSLAQSSPNVVYASILAQPEVFSALQRQGREGQLAQADAHRLARRVTSHFAWRYRSIAITPGVVAQESMLAQAHPLCAYDAVRLACALAVHQQLQQYGGPVLCFVAADETPLATYVPYGRSMPPRVCNLAPRSPGPLRAVLWQRACLAVPLVAPAGFLPILGRMV